MSEGMPLIVTLELENPFLIISGNLSYLEGFLSFVDLEDIESGSFVKGWDAIVLGLDTKEPRIKVIEVENQKEWKQTIKKYQNDFIFWDSHTLRVGAKELYFASFQADYEQDITFDLCEKEKHVNIAVLFDNSLLLIIIQSKNNL